jgi:hypothetical protein
MARVLKLKRESRSSTDGSPVLVFKLSSGRKRKKSSRGLGPMEKMVRRFSRANAEGSAQYLDRHERSSRKRRDGWLRDLPINVFKARRKGMKRLKLGRMFF